MEVCDSDDNGDDSDNDDDDDRDDDKDYPEYIYFSILLSMSRDGGLVKVL